MKIIGCDFHPSYQQYAMVEKETGEVREGRLGHEAGEARRFYEGLRGQAVRVGMEAMGNSQWFEQMLEVMGHELWLGGCGTDPAVGGAATEDGPARRAAYFEIAVRRAISTDMGTERGDAGCASVVASPAQAGGDEVAGEEPAAASGVEPGGAEASRAVEPRGPGGVGSVAVEGMDRAASARVVGHAGAVRRASGGEGSGGERGSAATAGSTAVDDASGSGTGGGAGVCADDRASIAISTREAGGQLSGVDSAGEIFGRTSEAGLDQQARKQHDAHAIGGSGADGIAIR